jgi:hypothetical protein
MSQSALESVQFPTSPEFKRLLEEAAARLNLSLSAYIMYLFHRGTLNPQDAARLDRDVREVFGKHGELMRRLAR